MKRLLLASVFALSTVGLVACGDESGNAMDPIGDWGVAEQSPGNAHLSFAKDGTYRGHDGCNTIMGDWTASADEVTLEPGITTMVGCPDGFQSPETVTVDGDDLVGHAGGKDLWTITRR